MIVSVLLAVVCNSAEMTSCEVWEEGRWTGPAASVYCTVERDYATALLSSGQYVRYECEDIEVPDRVLHEMLKTDTP